MMRGLINFSSPQCWR